MAHGIRFTGTDGKVYGVKKAYIGKAGKIKLTNQVPAISASNWAAIAGTIGTATGKYGTAVSLIGNASLPETTCRTTETYAYKAGHKYYVRCEVYFQNANTRRTTCYWPIAEPNIWNTATLGMSISANTWTMLGMVTDRVAAGFSAGSDYLRFDYDNSNTTGTMLLDGVMLIDLTEAFGAGNEPTQAWCNTLPYFTGEAKFAYDTAPSVAHRCLLGYIPGADGTARLVYEYGQTGWVDPGTTYLVNEGGDALTFGGYRIKL